MARFLGLGNGSDGLVTLSGTHAPVDSSCSGTSGASSLTATNASFAAGQRIFVNQTRGGANVGKYEDNTIESYTAGTITTVHPLENTYTDSGDSQAQVLVVPEYSGVTISGTFTAKKWDGNIGGIVPIVCNGKTTISGTLDGSGTDGVIQSSPSATSGGGFRGGASVKNAGTGSAYTGEGSAGASGLDGSAANGNGGGAGDADGTTTGAGGGGGSYGTQGTAGSAFGSATGGQPGNTVGDATIALIFLGGGGGGAVKASDIDGGSGGSGGAIVVIYSKELEVSGAVTCDGGAGGGQNQKPGGGGASGGTILCKTVKSVLGSSLMTADNGIGGDSGSGADSGGDGGDGRIRIESCSVSGTTSPTASLSTGGHAYCGGGAFIF